MLGGLSLDFKLGLRMLAKHPGLTVIGVLGMSVAVIIGALAFTAVRAITGGALPFDEGDRVVAIWNADTRGNRDGSRTHLHDLAVWRETLRAVEDLGAYRTSHRNLVATDGRAEAVRVAEMTASGFRLARTVPIRGRTLSADDEREGAPAVVVIGYDLWQRRFGGSDDVVGLTVQLGAARHTVIGVMPKGFAFPINDQIWTPLRLNPSVYERGQAPAVNVFGRLARGASLDDAQRQLTTIGQRLAAAYPRSHEHIRPGVRPYARVLGDTPRFSGSQISSLLHLGQVVVSLLLVVIATNVAILVYARTASRAGEMAVRTALGASRRRIVTQLFAEALVLSAVASAVGILVAHFAFRRVEAMVRQSVGDQIPYWMRLEITPTVVAYVAGLTVLAAVIIGVVPGLKATGHRVAESLKDLTGGSSVQLGRTWTALLIAQVAVSVAVLPVALDGGRAWVNLSLLDPGGRVADSFVIATPVLDAVNDSRGVSREDPAARRVRYVDRVAELERTLEAEPGGFDVVVMSSRPGAESETKFELLSSSSSTDSVMTTRTKWAAGLGSVDADFFEAFGVRTLTGRRFIAADFATTTSAAIVNASFVKHFLGGGNALGKRLRPARLDGATSAARSDGSTDPWWEIVGVVADFPVPEDPDALRAPRPKVYRPLRPAEFYPVTLGVRARVLTPAGAADRLRTVGMAVDPALRFTSIRTLDDLLNTEIEGERMAILALVMVALSVVLLSAAGIYALMSFTVARRTREIGIRAALGAQSGRVIAEILSRAIRQIAIGVAIGIVGMWVLAPLAGESSPTTERLVNLLQVIAAMVIVGFIATLGPARRALRVQPTEALRAE